MSISLEAPTTAARPQLGKTATLARLTLVAAILAAVGATFAYLGGWLTPNELTPARFTDGLEQANGLHPGFRRNHAKGLGVSGFFESNGAGVRLSTASVFRPGRVPVLGRFSLGNGLPYDADKPDTARGLGLQFSLPDGEVWRTAMIDLPVFPVRTPEGFHELFLASKPDPETGRPDPAKMEAFRTRHPETERTLPTIGKRPISSGFENSTFHGLHAYRFTNADGNTVPVRWLLKPEQPFMPAGPLTGSEGKNYLFDALIARIGGGPIQWRLVVIVGQPGDPTNDPSAVWPEGREMVDVGTLTLDRAESDETSPATDINFDPLVLPAGIAASDDPVLRARSAIYSQSFTRRAGERKQTPAITPAEVRKETEHVR
jgi:catalase